MPCIEKECIKIQKEYELSREFFESKKLDIPQLDSELCNLMKNYCAKKIEEYINLTRIYARMSGLYKRFNLSFN